MTSFKSCRACISKSIIILWNVVFAILFQLPFLCSLSDSIQPNNILHPFLNQPFIPILNSSSVKVHFQSAAFLNHQKERLMPWIHMKKTYFYFINPFVNQMGVGWGGSIWCCIEWRGCFCEEVQFIIILRMMSELNTGSMRAVCSSLASTQTFILQRLADRAEDADACSFTPEPSHLSAANLPLFNRDRRHYTPAFLSTAHVAALQQSDQQYKEAFFTKAQDECYHSSFILQPKPSSTFCFVCKEHFVDYSKHINHPVHKKFLASSACEDWISDLIQCERKKRRTPACGFVEPHEISRKMRKLETVEAVPTLALQYLKESSTCVTIFQAQKATKAKN